MKKVLFETHHLYYWPNFLPVANELLNRGKYDVDVSMPKRSSSAQENTLTVACSLLGLQYITAESEEKRIDKLINKNYDIIIVGNVGQLNKISSPEALVVMIYHGIGLKQSYYTDIDERIDIRSVESEARFKELKNFGHENLVLTGFTKLDRLIKMSTEETVSIRSNFNIDSNKKTLLYAPSFYPSSIDKLHPFFLELGKDFNVIIKLHGFSWEQKKYFYQNVQCSELSRINKNIHLLPNDDYDIIPYYLIADVLISDISSTMFEYLPIDKPIIQAKCYNLKLKHKIFKRRFWKKMDLDRQDSVDFAYQITEPDDILGMVYYAIENMDEMSDRRLEAAKYYLYKADGNASYRLVNAIEEY